MFYFIFRLSHQTKNRGNGSKWREKEICLWYVKATTFNLHKGAQLFQSWRTTCESLTWIFGKRLLCVSSCSRHRLMKWMKKLNLRKWPVWSNINILVLNTSTNSHRSTKNFILNLLMVADIKLLAFSSAKEGIVYWKRTFIRERRLLQISRSRGGVEHRWGEEFPEEFLRLKNVDM